MISTPIMQLLAAKFIDMKAVKVKVQDDTDTLSLVCGADTLLGPIPSVLSVPFGYDFPPVMVVRHVSNGYKFVPEMHILEPAAMLVSVFEEEGYAMRVYRVHLSHGCEGATDYTRRILRETLMALVLPLGETEQRYAATWDVPVRQRIQIGINPTIIKGYAHPAIKQAATIVAEVPAAAELMHCVSHVTSGSRPGEIVNAKGQTGQARLLEETVVGLSYLDPGRHSVASSAIRQACALKGGEKPWLIPTLNVGAMPDVLQTWTAFHAVEGTEGDMIVITPDAPCPLVKHTERFNLVEGSQVLVADGAVFVDSPQLLAISPAGRHRVYDTVEVGGWDHTITYHGELEDGLAGYNFTIEVTVYRPVGTGSKLIDLWSNKGLANEKPLEATVDFVGETLPIGAFLSPGRFSTTKMKTGGALVQAVLSQVAWLRDKRLGVTVEQHRIVHDISFGACLKALQAELQHHRENEDVAWKLQLLAELSMPETGATEAEMQAAWMELASWPVTVDGEFVGNVVISRHPFTVQPQFQEVITAQPPATCDDRLVIEDDIPLLNVRARTSKAGAPALWFYEGLFVKHHAPELASWLWGIDREPGQNYLADLLIRSILQKGVPIANTEDGGKEEQDFVERLLAEIGDDGILPSPVAVGSFETV